MPKKGKRPAQKKYPSDKHVPRGGNKAVQTDIDPISWHIRIIDMEGPWGWDKIGNSALLNHIHSKMSNFETMAWPEILKKGNHQILVSQVSAKAQKRLKAIKQNDVDELISLRLNSLERIWGIRDRNILKILWWDPKHEVNPVEKKHT